MIESRRRWVGLVAYMREKKSNISLRSKTRRKKIT
jgi:hypothetical protein